MVQLSGGKQPVVRRLLVSLALSFRRKLQRRACIKARTVSGLQNSTSGVMDGATPPPLLTAWLNAATKCAPSSCLHSKHDLANRREDTGPSRQATKTQSTPRSRWRSRMRSCSSRRFRRRFRAHPSSRSTRTPRMWSRETSSALPVLRTVTPLVSPVT